jgi:hypothetical protein
VIFTKAIKNTFTLINVKIFKMKVAPIFHTPSPLCAYVHGACVYGTVFKFLVTLCNIHNFLTFLLLFEENGV